MGLWWWPEPVRASFRPEVGALGSVCGSETGEAMARWARGEQAVQFLVGRNRLERFEAEDLAALTEALVARAVLRVETTATAALAGGDVDGAFVAAYDAYR